MMGLFRRLGREFERFRRLASAAAEETVEGRPEVRCPACEAWIPTRYERCPECGRFSPHAVLGVSPDAPEGEVKAAARERIKESHPDQGGSIEEFRRVKDARDRLLEE